MSETEIGVIGAGNIASKIHAPIINQMESVNLAFVADIDKERAARLANYYDAKPVRATEAATLPDCDAAVLAIPVGVREEYVAEFADRNTPMITEKPFAPDLEAHDLYLKKTNQIFCNYMRTYYNPLRQLDVILQSGLFGELQAISVSEEGKWSSTGISKSGYQANPEMAGGGVLMERGCHLLSQIVFLFRDYDISVEETEIIWNGELDTEVRAQMRIKNDTTNADLDLMISRLRPVGDETRLAFENATIVFEQTAQDEPLLVTVDGQQDELLIASTDQWAKSYNESMYLKWKRFVDVFLHGKEPEAFDLATGRRVTRLITEMYRQGGDE